MAYVQKNIRRPSGSAGNPSVKGQLVIFIDPDQIATFPTREVGTTTAAEGLTLKEGAKVFGVYATPGSIEILQESEGDADARGYKKGVKFAHPGVSAEIEDFAEYNTNRTQIAIVTACNGQAARIIGDPCNPLSMNLESQDNKDGAINNFTFQQVQRDHLRVLNYTGVLPALVEDAVPAAPASDSI